MLPTDMDKDGAIHSEWKGDTAGGCSNHPTAMNNPQMVLTIKRPTEVVLTLTQQDRRGLTIGSGRGRTFPIGISVLYGDSLDKARSSGDIKRYEVASSGKFSYDREVTLKMQLTMRGNGSTTKYIVVPSTFDAGQECEFTLRAFTQKGQPNVALVPGANCQQLPLRQSGVVTQKLYPL